MAKWLKQFAEDPDDDCVNCPNCGESIKSDATLCRFCDMGLSDQHFKECPSCAEMIRINATTCRFCKTDLRQAQGQSSVDSFILDENTVAEFAQSITGDILEQWQRSSDYASILQFALEKLSRTLKVDRGVIWTVKGNNLEVTQESPIGKAGSIFIGNKLGPSELTALVYEFLSRFPDESGTGVISISDTSRDAQVQKVSPMLCSLLELGDVSARLVVQLRAQGVFLGFLELQQCGHTREWTLQESALLQKVAQTLSIVLQHSADRSTIEGHLRDMRFLDRISGLYQNTSDWNQQQVLEKTSSLLAEHMGFLNSQVLVYDADSKLLKPQLQNVGGFDDDVSMENNPFADVFHSGRGRLVNVEFTRKGDDFFKHELAMILPLISQGERLGVIVWWSCLDNSQFRLSDRMVATAIASLIAQSIHIRRFQPNANKL